MVLVPALPGPGFPLSPLTCAAHLGHCQAFLLFSSSGSTISTPKWLVGQPTPSQTLGWGGESPSDPKPEGQEPRRPWSLFLFSVLGLRALYQLVRELGPSQAAGMLGSVLGPSQMGRKSCSLTQPWLVPVSGWTWPPPTLDSLSPSALLLWPLGSDQGSPELTTRRELGGGVLLPPRCADGKLSPRGRTLQGDSGN